MQSPVPMFQLSGQFIEFYPLGDFGAICRSAGPLHKDQWDSDFDNHALKQGYFLSNRIAGFETIRKFSLLSFVFSALPFAICGLNRSANPYNVSICVLRHEQKIHAFADGNKDHGRKQAVIPDTAL